MTGAIKHKICSSCKQSLPIERFSFAVSYKDGNRGQCKACRVAFNKKYPQKKYKTNPEVTRRTKIKRKYGMTVDDYQRMYDAQGGLCMICKTKEPGGKHGVLHVDHCHTTGKVRGLLCNKCNVSLGKFGDNVALVMRFVDYLQRHEQRCETNALAMTGRA